MLKHGVHESAGGARYSFLMGYNHSYDELARTQSISTGAVDGSVFIADANLLYWFPLMFALSMAGSIIGAYASAPTDMPVLKSFYSNVRPWGFWGPVKNAVMAGDPAFQPNKNFKLNMFNVVIGTIGQCCLTILPMYLILSRKMPLLVTIGLLAVVVIILKKTWWNKLKDY